MSELNELYRKKGEAQTQIEIWTGVLNRVNKEIGAEISKGNQKEIIEDKKDNA